MPARKTIIFGLLMALCPFSSPNASNSTFVAGVGYTDCASLSNYYAKDQMLPKYMTQSWIQGFVSALNMKRTDKKYYDLDGVQEMSWNLVMQYCNSHPMGLVIDTMPQILKSLRQVDNPEPLVSPPY